MAPEHELGSRSSERAPDEGIRRAWRYESVEDAEEVELRLFQVIMGEREMTPIEVTPISRNAEPDTLYVSALEQGYEETAYNKTYIFRLLNDSHDGLVREVTITIPNNGGKAVVGVSH